MLKRANISLAIAAVPGLLAYTNVFETLAHAATILFFLLVGFSVVSFLLCLFEDDPVDVSPITEKPRPLSWGTTQAQVIRIAP